MNNTVDKFELEIKCCQGGIKVVHMAEKHVEGNVAAECVICGNVLELFPDQSEAQLIYGNWSYEPKKFEILFTETGLQVNTANPVDFLLANTARLQNVDVSKLRSQIKKLKPSEKFSFQDLLITRETYDVQFER